MRLRAALACCLLSTTLWLGIPPAQAQQTSSGGPTGSILLQRIRAEAGRDLPSRGMSMKAVRLRYGAPQRQLAARGGRAPKQPVIHRWVYPGYIVYFERDRVIHSVATTSGDGLSAPLD
ncbi:hypothetical protein ACYJW8_05865 [Frateuria aurantia]